jgi:DNA-3-methyladenine glycosylase II
MGLAAAPDPSQMEAIGVPWRPWRAVAARLLWHFYLSTRPTTQERPGGTAS